METLRKEDPPDVVVGHTGWGGLLFARDALPDAALMGYCEYYYRSAGSDLSFVATKRGSDLPVHAAYFVARLRAEMMAVHPAATMQRTKRKLTSGS